MGRGFNSLSAHKIAMLDRCFSRNSAVIEILEKFCHEDRPGAAWSFGVMDVLLVSASGVEVADVLAVRGAIESEVDHDCSLL